MLNRRHILWICLAFAIVTISLRVSADEWLTHAKWDEGLAEICIYDGKQRKYGTLRDTQFELITVREHFDPDRLVKTRPQSGHKVLPVMKTNIVRRTRTGVYKYVQMASVFHHRKTGKQLKLSATSTEWCGNSFALYERKNGKTGEALLLISNYMDDKGTSRRNIKSDNTPVFHEARITYLRSKLDKLTEGRQFKIAHPLMTNDPEYGIRTARIGAVEHFPSDDDNPARTRVKLKIAEQPTETFVFKDTPLRPLLMWKNDNGEVLRLQQRKFLDYWNRNAPGDENIFEK